MEFGNKVLSKELLSLLYESDKTVGTAESCTAGGIASAITMVPGASNYFKGGVVSYWDDVKVNVLGVDADIIEEKTAVCEEVAKQMVAGAINALGVDYAVASTGFAGPGSEGDIPVGTIWIACGNKDEQITLQLTDDEGRDENIGKAVMEALKLLLDFVSAHEPARVGDEVVELTAE
ncbi:MAG: CinA family protein [Prevotella sp.]|nr:CinA family protein [Prevotella sp.]